MLIKLNGGQQDSRARGHDHVAEPHAMAAGTRVRVRSDLALTCSAASFASLDLVPMAHVQPRPRRAGARDGVAS